MSQHLVHFDCPKCGKELHVDAGFRGAVARCEHCGALIKVPARRERKGDPPGDPPRRPRQPGALDQPPRDAAGDARGAGRRRLVLLALAAGAVIAAVGVWALTR